MPLGFPAAPTTGQLHPSSNPTHRYSGALWAPLGGTPINARYSSIDGNTDFVAMVDGVPGMVAASVIAAYTGGSPAPTRPAVMTVNQWNVVGIANGLAIDIDGAPAGSPTSYDYSINNGVDWSPLPDGAALGVRNITPLAATERQVRVRGVNAVGPALDPGSDTKTATPLAGGGSFSATYTDHDVNGTEFQHPKVFPGLDIGAADATRRLYVYLFARGMATTDTITLSVNGGGALSPINSIRPNSNRQVLVFSADIPTGTTADFSFSSSGGNFNNCGVAIVRAVGAHTQDTAVSDNSASTSTSIATLAGDRIFLGAMYQSDGAAGFFGAPSGFTEHFDEPTRPSIPAQPATLRSGTAAGGSPETFTGTLGGGSGTSEMLLRLRAS